MTEKNTRRKIIAGNWKMNGTLASVEALAGGIKSNTNPFDPRIEFIVFPSFVHLNLVQSILSNSRVAYGAQDASPMKSGAYTGDVSISMLKEFGCQYVLVGHSERRSIHRETNETVAQKLAAVNAEGLQPIFCIGETLSERNEGRMETILQNQIDAVLSLPNGAQELTQSVIAYEPVWAIGTGVAATPEEAQNAHAFIRAYLDSKASNLGKNSTILYGGSLKPDNALSLFSKPDIDGGLIGGASLKVEDYLGIAACIKSF